MTSVRRPRRHAGSSDVGDEGGDEQQVDGQACRAGHEGRYEDGGDTVALVLNGGGGQVVVVRAPARARRRRRRRRAPTMAGTAQA